MACTNRRSGWPGYRWGRGPDWATTGKIRPVTEIQRGVDVAVDDLTGQGARQPLADSVFTDQPAGGTVGLSAAVVDLAGGKPAIRDNQLAAESGGLVDQLRPDRICAKPTRRPLRVPFLLARQSCRARAKSANPDE
jgi:hypothetical protein